MKTNSINYQFVDSIPETLNGGTLYVAMDFATAVHKCCCGCGKEVVTPLSPTDWKITYDGVSVSLSPSIGNWSFKCRSHYWIVRNAVKWAGQWSPEEIAAGRAHDRRAKGRYFDGGAIPKEVSPETARPNFWSKLRRWISGD